MQRTLQEKKKPLKACMFAKEKLVVFYAKQEEFSLKKLKYWDLGKKAGKLLLISCNGLHGM